MRAARAARRATRRRGSAAARARAHVVVVRRRAPPALRRCARACPARARGAAMTRSGEASCTRISPRRREGLRRHAMLGHMLLPGVAAVAAAADIAARLVTTAPSEASDAAYSCGGGAAHARRRLRRCFPSANVPHALSSSSRYFGVHLFEHTVAPHSIRGRTHGEALLRPPAGWLAVAASACTRS